MTTNTNSYDAIKRAENEPAKTRQQEVKKPEYYTLKTMVLKDSLFSEEVGAHAWIFNAPVTVLSTEHELGSEVVKT